MSKNRVFKELRDAYRFPYFTPSKQVSGIFGDAYAVVISLSRRQKKRNVAVVEDGSVGTVRGGPASSGIFLVAAGGYISS